MGNDLETETLAFKSEKSTKVKRTKSEEEVETNLEPINKLSQADSSAISVTPPASEPVSLSQSDLEPVIVDTLIKEIRQSPITAIKLIQTLGKITKDWEPIGTNGNPINEVPVPPGKNPRDFVRSTTTTAHVSGFKLTTIFGDEVALIMKDSPKWRVTIEGEYQIDTPFVEHSLKAESNAKKFAEDKLRERGFIIAR